MDDLLSIVVLILYFVLAGTFKKKDKKKTAQRAARRTVRFDEAFERMSSAHRARVSRSIAAQKEKRAAFAQDEAPEEGSDPCHEEMLRAQKQTMRLHNATQEEMLAAGEGMDPCHKGSASDELEESPVYRSPIFDTEDPQAFAQDVLRGIVMNEVLKRPVDRLCGAGMKRRA